MYLSHTENQKEQTFKLKFITMINTIMEWFEIMQYNDKHAITTAKLVKTASLTRYPFPK